MHAFDDTPQPHTPDSIFPNNWVSFHADGTVVLYPMLAENRRQERRADLLETISSRLGFRIARVLDLTHHEGGGKFLEGTGSLVLDRTHRIAYACVSPRTDLDVLGDFAQQLDYDIVAFEAADATGAAIYHTNVLMCIGARFAAVCPDCIRADERGAVLDALRRPATSSSSSAWSSSPRSRATCSNCARRARDSVVAMSRTALDSLSAQQRATIERLGGPIVAAAIPTIETLGGGSVRCMLAEIHLPKKV